MSRHRKLVVSLASFSIALLSGSQAYAQSDSVRFSRSEVQRKAFAGSSELTQRATAIAASRRVAHVSYPYNPEVSVEIEGARSPWSNREFTRRLRVEQEIDLRGERGARKHVGLAIGAVTQREYAERVQSIAAQVDEAYSRFLVARRKAALLEPLRERARELRAKAEGARRRETLTGFEARLLRAEALGIEADWLDARRQLDVAEAEIRTWLALHTPRPLMLEDDLDERPWRCDLDSALAQALQNRQALARAVSAESLALARVRLEQRLGRVNPALGASVARERTELESPVPIEDQDTFVGLEVRVPIPLFARNQTAISEARLELERAKADRAALEREIRQEVTTACAELERLEEERRLRAEAAESAGQDLRLIESAYGEGRVPLDEYLILRERLIRQQVAWIDAVGSVEEARVRLIRATGMERAGLARQLTEEK